MNSLDVFDQFWSFLKEEKYIDCTLCCRVSDSLPLQTYSAHKLILASQSSYFKPLLLTQSIITLPSDPYNVFPHILRFFYCRNLDIPLHKVMPLIAYAQHLELGTLAHQVQTKLLLLPPNPFALDLLSDAIEQQLHPLKISALIQNTVRQLGISILKLTKEPLSLPFLPIAYFDQFLEVLKSGMETKLLLYYILKYLNCNSEKFVKSAKEVKDLFRHVNFEEMPWKLLVMCLEDNWVPRTIIYKVMGKRRVQREQETQSEPSFDVSRSKDKKRQDSNSPPLTGRPLRLASLGYQKQEKSFHGRRPLTEFSSIRRTVSDSNLDSFESTYIQPEKEDGRELREAVSEKSLLKSLDENDIESEWRKDSSTESLTSNSYADSLMQTLKFAMNEERGDTSPIMLEKNEKNEMGASEQKKNTISSLAEAENIQSKAAPQRCSKFFSVIEDDGEFADMTNSKIFHSGIIQAPIQNASSAQNEVDSKHLLPPILPVDLDFIANPFTSHLNSAERVDKRERGSPELRPILETLTSTTATLEGLQVKDIQNVVTQHKKESCILNNIPNQVTLGYVSPQNNKSGKEEPQDSFPIAPYIQLPPRSSMLIRKPTRIRYLQKSSGKQRFTMFSTPTAEQPHKHKVGSSNNDDPDFKEQMRPPLARRRIQSPINGIDQKNILSPKNLTEIEGNSKLSRSKTEPLNIKITEQSNMFEVVSPMDKENQTQKGILSKGKDSSLHSHTLRMERTKKIGQEEGDSPITIYNAASTNTKAYSIEEGDSMELKENFPGTAWRGEGLEEKGGNTNSKRLIRLVTNVRKGFGKKR